MDLQGFPLLLDFSPGLDLSSKVRSSFSTSISPSPDDPGFHLAVSFGRANFCLDANLVGFALQSRLGDIGSDIRVTPIWGRVFKFSVISKAVGFLIYHLRSFSCPSFKCFFHLCGLGGPNWRWELSIWSDEQASEWQVINRRKTPLTGANDTPITPGRTFATMVHGTRSDLISSDQAPPPRRPTISNSLCSPCNTPAHHPYPPSPAHLNPSPFRLQSDLVYQRYLPDISPLLA
jgi:hypothetical protein